MGEDENENVQAFEHGFYTHLDVRFAEAKKARLPPGQFVPDTCRLCGFHGSGANSRVALKIHIGAFTGRGGKRGTCPALNIPGEGRVFNTVG